jgi:hypothetical protein
VGRVAQIEQGITMNKPDTWFELYHPIAAEIYWMIMGPVIIAAMLFALFFVPFWALGLH